MTALPLSQSRPQPERPPVSVRLHQGDELTDVFAPPYAPVDIKQYVVDVLTGAVGDGGPIHSADELESAVVASLVSRFRRDLDVSERFLVGLQASFAWNDRYPKPALARR